MVNSGHTQDRQLINALRKKEATERHDSIEAPAMAQGNAAESFKAHPFWKVIDRDFTQLEQTLIAQLTDTSKSLSKYVMDELRRNISSIRLFRDHPNKYIQKLRDVQKRRGKGV